MCKYILKKTKIGCNQVRGTEIIFDDLPSLVRYIRKNYIKTGILPYKIPHGNKIRTHLIEVGHYIISLPGSSCLIISTRHY